MKYSIGGSLNIADGSEVVNLLNNYILWKLNISQINDVFSFEAWVNSEQEKDLLFNELKQYVDDYGEKINWHICTHDEQSPQPCVISEEYVR